MIPVPTAIVVPGSGHLHRDRTYRIGPACRLLVAEAEQLAESMAPQVVVFSGWSVTGGTSEAEQMRDLWRGPDVELVVEPLARTTVSNATRTRPLLVERGVRTAVVLTTPLHLRRARFVFTQVYDEAGIEAGFQAVPVPRPPRALVRELAARSTCRLQLHAARAAIARGRVAP
jgi:uncharacterized SAM-binding protein YcdF (DUF218 family)